MYFEFHKLVDLNLPHVIFKADLLWSESNPEFRPIRIRNYKYYINIRLPAGQVKNPRCIQSNYGFLTTDWNKKELSLSIVREFWKINEKILMIFQTDGLKMIMIT
jgi:hypothetical protein